MPVLVTGIQGWNEEWLLKNALLQQSMPS